MPETENERGAAATLFYRFAQFPRTIGAIDCTHVKVQSPGGQLVCLMWFVSEIFFFNNWPLISFVR